MHFPSIGKHITSQLFFKVQGFVMDVYFILFIVSSNYAALSAFQLNVTLPKKLLVKALSSAEAPAGYPNKNSNNRKIARGGRWEKD